MPVTGWAIPLGRDFAVPSDIREKLSCTTIVTIGDGYYLTLWEYEEWVDMHIAWTFITLGYYPPHDICNLAGRLCDKGPQYRQLVQRCNEGLRIMIQRFRDRISDNRYCVL
jgi:hypothetical protein